MNLFSQDSVGNFPHSTVGMYSSKVSSSCSLAPSRKHSRLNDHVDETIAERVLKRRRFNDQYDLKDIDLKKNKEFVATTLDVNSLLEKTKGASLTQTTPLCSAHKKLAEIKELEVKVEQLSTHLSSGTLTNTSDAFKELSPIKIKLKEVRAALIQNKKDASGKDKDAIEAIISSLNLVIKLLEGIEKCVEIQSKISSQAAFPSVTKLPYKAENSSRPIVVGELFRLENLDLQRNSSVSIATYLEKLRSSSQIPKTSFTGMENPSNLCYLISGMQVVINNYSELLNPKTNQILRQMKFADETLESNLSFTRRKILQKGLYQIAQIQTAGSLIDKQYVVAVFNLLKQINVDFEGRTIHQQFDAYEAVKVILLAIGAQSAKDNYDLANHIELTSIEDANNGLELAPHIPHFREIKEKIDARGTKVMADQFRTEVDIMLNAVGGGDPDRWVRQGKRGELPLFVGSVNNNRSISFMNLLDTVFLTHVNIEEGVVLEADPTIRGFMRRLELRNLPRHIYLPCARVRGRTETDDLGIMIFKETKDLTKVIHIPQVLDLASRLDPKSPAISDGDETKYRLTVINLHPNPMPNQGHYSTAILNRQNNCWEWNSDSIKVSFQAETSQKSFDMLSAYLRGKGCDIQRAAAGFSYERLDASISDLEGSAPNVISFI
jgi:hypothetical protein